MAVPSDPSVYSKKEGEIEKESPDYIIHIYFDRYYYSVKGPVQTIVFNDLKEDGFRTASRETGLDWAHASLILQQLGKFHATSMVLAKKVNLFHLLCSRTSVWSALLSIT